MKNIIKELKETNVNAIIKRSKIDSIIMLDHKVNGINDIICYENLKDLNMQELQELQDIKIKEYNYTVNHN